MLIEYILIIAPDGFLLRIDHGRLYLQHLNLDHGLVALIHIIINLYPQGMGVQVAGLEYLGRGLEAFTIVVFLLLLLGSWVVLFSELVVGGGGLEDLLGGALVLVLDQGQPVLVECLRLVLQKSLRIFRVAYREVGVDGGSH